MPVSIQAVASDRNEARGGFFGGPDRALNYSLAAPIRSPALAPPRSPTPSPSRVRPRPRSPGPSQRSAAAATTPRESSSVPSGIPSWVTAWSKPTVSSSQLHDGPQLKDFVATPLPASSASRVRRAGNMSTGGANGGASSPFGAPDSPAGGGRGAPLRATSIGRGGAAQAEGSESTVTAGSSVLMHFLRVNSGAGPGMGLTTASSAPLLFRSAAAARSSWSPNPSVGPTPANVPSSKFAGGAWAWVVTQPPGGGGSGGGARPSSAGLKRTGSLRASVVSGNGGLAGSGGGAAAASGPQPRQRPLSAGHVRGGGCGGKPAAIDAVDPASTPGSSLGTLLLRRMASRRAAIGRPASAGGNGMQRGGAGSGAAAASGASPFAAAGGRATRPPALVTGFEPEPPRRRGPGTSLELTGLGPDEADLGYLVDASDLLLAGGPASPVPTVIAPGPPPSSPTYAYVSVEAEEGEGEGGVQSPAMQLIHMPLPQHVLLPGSLQDLYERIGRSGDRPLHFSLGAVTFSGDLDPAINDVIRIQNRIVILHNCTLILRPGQQIWVGDGGHLILADVNVYATTATPPPPGAAAAAAGADGSTSARGLGRSAVAAAAQQGAKSGSSGGGAANPAVQPAAAAWNSPPASPPPAKSPKRAQSRLGGSGGTVSFKDSTDDGDGDPAPLLRVATGGRMLLRGCRVKILAHGEPIPGAPTSTGGPILAAPPPPSSGQPPRSPRPSHLRNAAAPSSPRGAAHAAPAAAAAATSSSPAAAAAAAASAVPLSSLVCVAAEGGGIVEAIGCRLGRCTASGADTSLTLRRCRVKPGAACPRDAPLLSASDGAYLAVGATELRDAPGLGLAASGPANTRVEIAHSAVTSCGSHGAMVLSGVELTATECRFTDNGASGFAARGRGASALLSDCELSGNAASNLWVSNGGGTRLVACALLGSGEGCGANVEGRGSRVAAEGCAFDANSACGVRVRRSAELDLRDCSASGNGTHGIDVEGVFEAADNAERMAEATLAAEIPPPPPLPDIFVVIAGGQLAKNGAHGCRVTCGGGLRVTGSEISQNGEDGAYADGPGCELLLDACRVVRNADNGVFICSGAAVWVDGCRLGGNLLGHVAVGGRGSRGRLTRCTFEYSPVTALRVQMGAKVALRDCEMESAPVAPTASNTAKPPPLTRTFYNVDELRKRPPSDDGGDILDGPEPWAVGSIRSKFVKLIGQGSLLSIDGRAIFATTGDDGRPLGI